MISMGLPNVRKFPFVESPDQENIEQTIHGLKQHVRLIQFRFNLVKFNLIFNLICFPECAYSRRTSHSFGTFTVQFTCRY